MSTLNDTDLFVIERSGTQYKARSDELSTLNDTDLFVVERSGTQYKVAASDVDLGPSGSMNSPVAVVTPVNGAGLNAGTNYEPLSTTISTVSGPSSITKTTDTASSVANVSVLSSISSQRVGSGSSAIAAIYINDTIVTGSSLGATSTGGFYALSQMFDTNENTVSYSQSSATSTYTFNPPLVITGSLKVRGWNSDAGGKVLVNGHEVSGFSTQSGGGLGTQTIPSSSYDTIKELTFPSSDNFDLFSVNDKVNHSPIFNYISGPTPLTFTDQINAFTNNTDYAVLLCKPGVNTVIEWEPPAAISGSNVTLRCRFGTSGGSSSNVAMSVGSNSVNAQGVGSMQDKTISIPGGSLDKITFTVSGFDVQQGFLLESIKVDGTQLIGNTYIDEFTVKTIDTTNNKVTVDGGVWTTSDRLEKTITSDQTFTFTDDTELANMVAPLEMVDATGNVVVPVTSAITNVANTGTSNSGMTATAAGWQSPHNAINGNDGSKAPSSNNTAGTITFSQNLVGVTKVRAKTRFYSGGTARLYKDGNIVHSVNHNSNNATQYYTIYDGPAIEIDQYWQQMSSSSASDDFWALEINGQIVQTGSNGSALQTAIPNNLKTLTFASPNNDLGYFDVGDTVATQTWTQTGVENFNSLSSPTAWRDGSLSTSTSVGYANNNGNVLAGFKITFTPGLTGITSLRTASGIGSSNNFSPRFSVNGGAKFTIGSWQWQGGAFPLYAWPSNKYSGVTINSIEVWNAQNNDPSYSHRLAAIELNGAFITGSGINYTIDSINSSSNTMVVTGGPFSNGDTITGDPVSATASTIDFVNGTTLGVSGVSGTWLTGLYAEGAQITATAPGPSSFVLQS